MTIYAKRLNSAQRWMLKEYESLTGFEPMHQDELDSGEMTFAEVWAANINWFHNVWGAVQNIYSRGAGL